MDLATIVGIVFAISALLVAVVLEGGHPTALLNLPAFVIVFGGTFGVTVACFPISAIKMVPKWIGVAMKENKSNTQGMIKKIVELAETARREGILKLENMLEDIEDQFLRQGVTLVVDGTDYEVTKTILRTELELMEERHRMGAKFFDAAGGYAPTMGIIGTVMGLVHVLGNLSDTASLGGAIATAFIATLYGVASANILWLPIATKLKVRNESEVLTREIIMEGVLAIQAGESPRIIEDRLKSFLPPQDRFEHHRETAPV